VYNLKDYDNSMMDNVISLSAAPAANGQWHSLSMKRIGRWFQLKMDSGEGRYYNETWGSVTDSQFFNLKRDQIVSGSMLKFVPNADFHSKDLSKSKLCINVCSQNITCKEISDLSTKLKACMFSV
jgi:hypothetical protein